MLRRSLILFCLSFFLALPASAAERRTAVVDAVALAGPAVVNIRTEQIVQRRSSPFFGFGDSLFDQFFSEMLPSRSYRTQSLGSGVIIDPQGHILTNAHVVDKASKIYVALAENSREYEAELIGQDNGIDLAVLKIVEEGPFPYLLPGRSDDLLLGETVIAIGNPLGLGHSLTTGIVSSLKRQVPLAEGVSSVFIQTDALINPGNSGGPLININGQLIGINTAIARQAQGIGFSIPIDTAKRVLGDLIEFGRVRQGFSGLEVSSLSDSFVQAHGEGGVLIDWLEPDSPAERAGLQLADVVLALDGVALSSPDEFYSLLRSYPSGGELELQLLRQNQRLTGSLVLSDLPAGYETAYTRRVFGFTLKQAQSTLLIERVVPGSAAARVGLKPGDQLAEVAGDPVTSLTDYRQVLAGQLRRKPLSFTVVRDQRGYVVSLPDRF